MPDSKKAPSFPETFSADKRAAILEMVYPGITATAMHRVFNGLSLVDGKTDKPKDGRSLEFARAAYNLSRRFAKKYEVKFTPHAAEIDLYKNFHLPGNQG